MMINKIIDACKISQMDLKNLTIPIKVERLSSLKIETSYEHAEYIIKMQSKLNNLKKLGIHVLYPMISLDISKFCNLEKLEISLKVR